MVAQELPILWMRGIGGQGLLLPQDGLPEPDAGFGEAFRVQIEQGHVIERRSDAAHEIGRRGMLACQFLLDRQCQRIRFQRLGRLSGCTQQVADRIANRIRAAQFRDGKTLATFDWHFNAAAIDRGQIEELATGAFIGRRGVRVVRRLGRR
jgi:hypothetical protein